MPTSVILMGTAGHCRKCQLIGEKGFQTVAFGCSRSFASGRRDRSRVRPGEYDGCDTETSPVNRGQKAARKGRDSRLTCKDRGPRSHILPPCAGLMATNVILRSAWMETRRYRQFLKDWYLD